MSTINANIINPYSPGIFSVNLNGVRVGSTLTTIQLGENTATPASSDSVLIGKSSGNLLLAASSNNTFVGYRSGKDCTTGSANTLIGKSAGEKITSGTSNTFIGSNVAVNATTGPANIAIGESAGAGLTTGSSNIFIGNSCANTPNITGIGNIVIGSGGGVNPSAANSVFEITLGGPLTSALRCAQTTITSLSDGRDKKDITELRAGLSFVNKLKPVEFVWNDRDENGKRDIADFGFIAQDLKDTQEEVGLSETLKLVYETNPDKLEASYGKLVPILVKAIQDLSKELEDIKNKLN